MQPLPHDQTQFRSRALVRCDRPAWRGEFRGGGLSRLFRRGGGRWGACLDDVGLPPRRQGREGQPLKPKPVNNARADKLDGFFWRYSFAERRCLIPLTAWAEAGGAEGRQDAELALASQWRIARRCRGLARQRRMGPVLFDGDDRGGRPGGRLP